MAMGMTPASVALNMGPLAAPTTSREAMVLPPAMRVGFNGAAVQVVASVALRSAAGSTTAAARAAATTVPVGAMVVGLASAAAVVRRHQQRGRRRSQRCLLITQAVAADAPEAAVVSVAAGVAQDRVTLGTLDIPAVGVGTLNWPLDRSVDAESEGVVRQCLDLGVDFIDTAEAYGLGNCERLTADCVAKVGRPCQVATKFAPVPFRRSADDIVKACEASCERLGVASLDLYQIHFPDIIQPLKAFGIEERKDRLYWSGLAECYKRGLAKNVGVSNYGPKLLQECFDYLDLQGVPLVSNQFNYSLLYRKSGAQATVDKCKELGITVLAYFPLGMGLLAGKYDDENRPTGFKGFQMGKYFDGGQGIPKTGVMPLVRKLREVAERYDKTPAQVSLNWVVCKGAVPIPGARTAAQAADNAGAMGWRLDDADVAALEEVADSLGFEFSGGGFNLES